MGPPCVLHGYSKIVVVPWQQMAFAVPFLNSFSYSLGLHWAFMGPPWSLYGVLHGQFTIVGVWRKKLRKKVIFGNNKS